MPRYGLDHAVVKVVLEADVGRRERRRTHLFKFEEVWYRDKNGEAIVKDLWNGAPWPGVSKLAAMQERKENFKEYKSNTIRNEIKRIEEWLAEE